MCSFGFTAVTVEYAERNASTVRRPCKYDIPALGGQGTDCASCNDTIRTFTLYSFLTITGKSSVTTGTLLFVFGSCERHSKLTEEFVLFVGCLSSQQHASVSQGRICTDNFTCCHTETEAADQTFHLTQSQYTDTGPTSPSADPITPGAWQGSHGSANF